MGTLTSSAVGFKASRYRVAGLLVTALTAATATQGGGSPPAPTVPVPGCVFIHDSSTTREGGTWPRPPAPPSVRTSCPLRTPTEQRTEQHPNPRVNQAGYLEAGGRRVPSHRKLDQRQARHSHPEPLGARYLSFRGRLPPVLRGAELRQQRVDHRFWRQIPPWTRRAHGTTGSTMAKPLRPLPQTTTTPSTLPSCWGRAALSGWRRVVLGRDQTLSTELGNWETPFSSPQIYSLSAAPALDPAEGSCVVEHAGYCYLLVRAVAATRPSAARTRSMSQGTASASSAVARSTSGDLTGLRTGDGNHPRTQQICHTTITGDAKPAGTGPTERDVVLTGDAPRTGISRCRRETRATSCDVRT